MNVKDRFLRYVQIHTSSDEESGLHPSFAGEWDLAHLLAKELKELGLQDVIVDEHAYVYGFLPATKGFENIVPFGFIAHMDTSSEAPGRGVSPVVHENYDGAEVVLGNSGLVLSPKQFPFLKKFCGETLITSDGNTLLGADDKAGAAEIMTALAYLQKHQDDPSAAHGPLYIAFTPDEEIGEGTAFFDQNRFRARFAYTVDGGDVDCLEYENFNAASAEVHIHGVSIHPGDAKDIMINAGRVAMEYDALIPEMERPEHTEGREGFFHLTDMQGNVSEAKLSYIIRDHDRQHFARRKEIVLQAAEELNERYGAGTVEIAVKDSYYNMIEKILPHPELIELAKAAIRDAGFIPCEVPIRGGTDGARLSFMGIPCPNLGTGGYNFHGKYECITVERMEKAVEILLGIIHGVSRDMSEDKYK